MYNLLYAKYKVLTVHIVNPLLFLCVLAMQCSQSHLCSICLDVCCVLKLLTDNELVIITGDETYV